MYTLRKLYAMQRGQKPCSVSLRSHGIDDIDLSPLWSRYRYSSLGL